MFLNIGSLGEAKNSSEWDDGERRRQQSQFYQSPGKLHQSKQTGSTRSCAEPSASVLDKQPDDVACIERAVKDSFIYSVVPLQTNFDPTHSGAARCRPDQKIAMNRRLFNEEEDQVLFDSQSNWMAVHSIGDYHYAIEDQSPDGDVVSRHTDYRTFALKETRPKFGRERSCPVSCRGSIFNLLCFSMVYIIFMAIGALTFKFIETPAEHEAFYKFDRKKREFLEQNQCVDEKALEYLLFDFALASAEGMKPFISAFARHAEDIGNLGIGNLDLYLRNINQSKLPLQSLQMRSDWEFDKSLFFCTTIVTTIGYGKVVPRTQIGRALCIIFACIGIPFTLFLSSSIIFICLPPIMRLCEELRFRTTLQRSNLAKIANFCRVRETQIPPTTNRPLQSLPSDGEAVHSIASIELVENRDLTEDLKRPNSFRKFHSYPVIPLQRNLNNPWDHQNGGTFDFDIKRSYEAPEDRPNVQSSCNSHLAALWKECFAEYRSETVVPTATPDVEVNQSESEISELLVKRKLSNRRLLKPLVETETIKRISSAVEEQQPKIESNAADSRGDSARGRILISLLLILLVMLVTLTMPAFIFQSVEKNWSYLDALYFCFISLTTIGLGDFIPNDWHSNYPGRGIEILYGIGIIVYLLSGTMTLMLLLRVCRELLKFHPHPPAQRDDITGERAPQSHQKTSRR